MQTVLRIYLSAGQLAGLLSMRPPPGNGIPRGGLSPTSEPNTSTTSRPADQPRKASGEGQVVPLALNQDNLRMRADTRTDGLLGMPAGAGDDLVEVAVEVFSMLADATRVKIVLALADGELSVNTLADLLGKPAATVSQHLAKLRMARILTTRRDGTRVFYRLANEHAHRLVTDAMLQAEHTVEDDPRHHR